MKSELDKYFIPEPNSGCWLWIGELSNYGYGVKRVNNLGSWRKAAAHRVVYQLYVGIIPDNCDLDHLCCTRCCVNPNHLEPVSHSENVRRMHSRRRESKKQFFNLASQANRKFCKHGHKYVDGSYYTRSNGAKRCKECIKNEKKRYRDRPNFYKPLHVSKLPQEIIHALRNSSKDSDDYKKARRYFCSLGGKARQKTMTTEERIRLSKLGGIARAKTRYALAEVEIAL